MKYIIFGLGNIGAEYANTRHNIGFEILDAYAKASNIVFTTKRYADIAETRVKGRQITLVKPSTYMNLSGKAVRYWMQNLNVPIENILVIADDINLPFGKIKIKPKGGDGGHNGLKSIIDLLGSANFARYRYGVGNDFNRGQQVDYVLGNWTDEEIKLIEKSHKKSIDMINSFVIMGLERTMNFFN